MYDPVDARISQSQTSVRSDGGGGEDPDSPDPPPGSATGRRLQLARNLTAKRNNNKILRTLYGYVVEARSLELPKKIQFGLLSLIKLRKMIQS